MINKVEFYNVLSQESAAIKCDNKEQWRIVYDEVVQEHPEWKNDDIFDYQPAYPYFVIWFNQATGFNGDSPDHPNRFSFSEFVSIIHNIDVNEVDLDDFGDLL